MIKDAAKPFETIDQPWRRFVLSGCFLIFISGSSSKLRNVYSVNIYLETADCSHRDGEVLSRCLRDGWELTVLATCQRWSDTSRWSVGPWRTRSSSTSRAPRRRYRARPSFDWDDPVSARWPRRTGHVIHAGTSLDGEGDALRSTCPLHPTAARSRSPSFLQYEFILT